MRSLKDIYPEFSESVDFYAVNVDASDSLKSAAQFGQNQGWTFPVAHPSDGMLRDFRVTKQSTKVAFDGSGVITYRDGFGGGNADTWRQVLQDLGG